VPYISTPSPLIDAVDPFTFPDRGEKPRAADDALADGCGIVKIGQTSLHNPSGRSSWIGL
jgi:protein arginine N-methyltransferase 5